MTAGLDNSNNIISLGNPFFEEKGKIIGHRILTVMPDTKVEYTISLDGIMNGSVNITDIGTLVSTSIGDRIFYSQGQGVISICNYIVVQKNEQNIKESTVEGIIKKLVWLSSYLENKSFSEMTKEDILDYLNSIKKSSELDPTHKSIGTYNGRQMVFSTFFRWLYNQGEPDCRKRITPPCMNGVKRLPRQERSPYKPSDLWTSEEHSIFLKFCPNKRTANKSISKSSSGEYQRRIADMYYDF